MPTVPGLGKHVLEGGAEEPSAKRQALEGHVSVSTTSPVVKRFLTAYKLPEAGKKLLFAVRRKSSYGAELSPPPLRKKKKKKNARELVPPSDSSSTSRECPCKCCK
eukprot:TRINITY_DN12363_c0_g2_i1.p2 TRINITY_DN12363_c0_g2~~TRINITY_DN12363_c0_g2_i1.p2  ORF type:complete len:106 (+),score=8.17 TRINITY_DN12363_c0_g2_i1:239-556(+)